MTDFPAGGSPIPTGIWRLSGTAARDHARQQAAADLLAVDPPPRIVRCPRCGLTANATYSSHICAMHDPAEYMLEPDEGHHGFTATDAVLKIAGAIWAVGGAVSWIGDRIYGAGHRLLDVWAFGADLVDKLRPRE